MTMPLMEKPEEAVDDGMADGGEEEKECKYVSRYARATDSWCMDNCCHPGAVHCPPEYCVSADEKDKDGDADGGDMADDGGEEEVCMYYSIDERATDSWC